MGNIWTIIQIVLAVIKAIPTIWAIIKDILDMIDREKDPVKKFKMKTDFRRALIETRSSRTPRPLDKLIGGWKGLA